LICKPLEVLCSRLRAEEDIGEDECLKLEHSLMFDLLLGMVEHEGVNDRGVVEAASKGLFHALGVAGRLSRETGRYAIVVSTDPLLSGVVVVSPPPGLGSELSACAVNYGILVDCDTPGVAHYWPQSNRRVRVMLVEPSLLAERARSHVSLLKAHS